MKTQEEIIELYSSLSYSEKRELLKSLQSETHLSHDFEKVVIKQESEQVTICPHCSSTQINGWGSQSGHKRYKCKSCGKTFNTLTGTSLYYIKHRDKFIKYLEHIKKGSTIRAAAKDLGINIATSFSWRHKILSSLKDKDETPLKGIIEADEAFFLLSEKGSVNLKRKARKRGGKASKPGTSMEQVNVLISSDRSGNKYAAISNLGRISNLDIERIMKSKIDKESILCSDANHAYTLWCKNNDLKHYSMNMSKKQYIREKIYHIQHVNNDTKKLKEWLEYKFHGVATRYLQNYLNWNSFNQKTKNVKEHELLWIKHIMENKMAKLKLSTNYIRFETLIDEFYYPLFSKT